MRKALRERLGAHAIERDGALFLSNPDWGEREKAQFAAVVGETPAGWRGDGSDAGWLAIPTGGSSGNLKLARHDEHTLGAAALGFARFYGLERVNFVNVLPEWHISGLMAWLRAAWTGGVCRTLSWRDLVREESSGLFSVAPHTFLSLVPTQLARLLKHAWAREWLRGFRAILVGGAPMWPELRLRAREEGLPVAQCYGSTETAALVAAQWPEEFAAGDDSCGRALPHARFEITLEGVLCVVGESLFRGYWPGERAGEGWCTADLAKVDAEGRLTVLGRADGLIISGGEKVNPAEVEAVLRSVLERSCPSAELRDVIVTGVPHPEWGQEVVALVSGELSAELETALIRVCAQRLAVAKRPKRYRSVPPAHWPRDARGKVCPDKLATFLA